MNKEALIAGHEAKKILLKEVIIKRIYKKRPRNLSPYRWGMQRKIGFRYAFQDKTLEELGEQYGRTKEDMRQLNHNFLDNIHKNSSSKLRVQFPREAIPDRKPLTQKSIERMSEIHGGKSQRVRKLIK